MTCNHKWYSLDGTLARCEFCKTVAYATDIRSAAMKTGDAVKIDFPGYTQGIVKRIAKDTYGHIIFVEVDTAEEGSVTFRPFDLTVTKEITQ